MKLSRLLLPCTMAFAAAGCVWPFAPADQRTLLFDGRVVRADGSAVGGVEVEITDGFDAMQPGDPPRPDGLPECGGIIRGLVVRATTRADGTYRIERRDHSWTGGACLRIRVAPPAGTPLAEHVVQSESGRYLQRDAAADLLHRRVDVTVPWPR